MPTTVTASNGVAYHLWQLPDLSAPEPQKSIQITTIKNELGDGYRTSLLTGSNNGVRTWKLTLPTLAGSSVMPANVTDINGATVSREQYVWSLYVENQVTGTPFVYQDPDTLRYYLVDFMDDKLTYQRMRLQLYSTGVEIVQRRMTGVSVFNIGSMFGSQPNAWFKDALLTDNGGGATAMALTGDVLTDSSTGFDVFRFNSVTNTGKIKQTSGSLTIYDVFIVMKVREATFSNTAGVFGGTTEQFLIGTSGGNKFTNLSIGDEYRYNGTLMTPSNMTAPMNTWGLVHQRFTAGRTITDPQLGQDRTVGTSTKAKMDVAEIIYFAGSAAVAKLPLYLSRELTEHLLVKYSNLIGA